MRTRFFNYGIIGSSGKLGSEVKSVLSSNGGASVFSYKRSGEYKIAAPQVLIDCSLPEVFDKTISFVNKFNASLVIATTGLSDAQIGILKKVSESVPVVQSYNFSVGIQVLLNLVHAAKNYVSDWDVEIEEVHHRLKKDKPSGTAKMIQNIFKDKDVNISSLRLGSVVGEHSVHFGTPGEILTIKHSAASRRIFAQGILKATRFSLQKKNGFFTFADVIYSDTEYQI